MRLRRFLRTSAFRLTLAYTAVFGLSVLLLLGAIYWATAQNIGRAIDDTIASEIDALAQHYRTAGLAGLVRAIEGRTGPHNVNGGLYLLTDPGFRRIAGNVTAWPANADEVGSWVVFPLAGDGTEAAYGRARAFKLQGGFNLLVGRDTRALDRFQNLMAEAMTWALAGTLVLGLGGGLLVSRRVLARIDGLNRGAETIMRGDVTHRMQTNGSGDEFDRLAHTLNQMLDQIERLMTGIRTVTNNVAHDLRSPLTRIRSQLEQAVARGGSAEDLREAAAQAMAEADGLLATFNALLSIAEAEAGVAVADPVTVDLGALVEDVADLYGPVAEEKGLVMTAAAVQPGLTVQGSRELLFQALGNLVDNAIKYTPAGGTIHVEAAPGPALVVRDCGPGIPEADRARVTDRFVRLDASRTTPGNGLGLSLVAAIVRMHRARLDFADAAPGLRASIVFEG
ncbi:sensor histidine kinase [Caenispirillum bisanense]|uniref:histidine kinase n=1 Tax=Caenispirillum bisanense TaxID=414052 RepID=A0A286GX56_9PROT|nr:HAMP domain-containing sensor histidine kinase [Caenispirillum bisanense]SOE00125.1 Signal transduction histidine kinase [Caenispirillum bisanense]